MGKYWVVLVTGWLAMGAAGEKADESLAGKDPNQSAAGENEAENPGTAQAQAGDADKRLKKATRTEDTLSVRELLERYAATQKEALTSFIHKTETREDRDIHCTEQHGGISARFLKDTQYYEHEVRTDGVRAKCIFSNWGQVRENVVLSRDNRGYASWLWDSDQAYSYSRYEDPSDAGILILRPDGPPESYTHQKNFAGHIGAASWGYLVGDVERFDEMLLKATKISVRKKKVKIRGVLNYVIDAVNERGSYTIWIDPEHGYNFSKAVVQRQAGGKAFQIVVQPGEEYLAVVENTKFQEIDGVWIPWEATIKDHRKYANGDYIDDTKSLKVLSMKINPDHEALGSFLLDDIRNGAWTKVHGIVGIDYTWQDGKVVDKAGKVVDLRASKSADPNQPAAGEEEVENPGAVQAQPDDNDKRLKKATRTEDTLSVRELLERYAATQKQAFTSFIHRTETREDRDIHCTEQHGGISARFLKDTQYYEHEVRTDGSRAKCIFCNWGQVRENIVLSRDNRHYVSWLWDGDKAYSYGHTGDPADAGRLSLRPDGPDKSYTPQNKFAGHIGAATWGYLFGDVERFDEMLLKATNISVRNRKEKIRRISNYVIDAVNERGRYTIWIDPEHGYNFSKAVVYRRAGDKAFQIVLQPGEEYMAVVENTKFQEIDGVWIPWEATMENQRKFANGDYTHLRKSLKVLAMEINPDHEARGSFLTDDIRNGAWTKVHGIVGIDYTWQDGKVVDKAGKVLDLRARQAADPNQVAGEKADESLAGKDPNQAAAAKEMAPLFTVQSLEGKEIRLEDYRGKVVLLYFWATWCRPCVRSLPNMKKFYEEMRKFDKFEMIGLSMDTESSESRLRQLIREYELAWPQGRIGLKSKICADYNNDKDQAPQYILIGPEGEILSRDLDQSALKTALGR